MKRVSYNKHIIISVIFSAIFFVVAALMIAPVNFKKADAAETLARPTTVTTANSDEFFIRNGAAVRVSSSGIKFVTYVTPEYHNALTSDGATVTYFATAKKVGGTTELAKEIPFRTTVNGDGNYELYTYLNFDSIESGDTSTVKQYYANDYTTSTFAKVVSSDGNTTTYYQAYSEAKSGDYDIVRSMRAVGNEAYLNWTEGENYSQSDVEKYFTVGARSNEITAYGLDTGKVTFSMPNFNGANSVTAYVGAEKHTATLNADGNYEIAGCTKVAKNLSVFTDDGTNTVYSTKMTSATELNQETIDKLQTATNGYYVLTQDIDMTGKTWAPSVRFTGTIDGNGHKIYNFTSSNTSVNVTPSGASARFMYPGLLCYTGAGTIIKNLDVHMVTNGIRGGLIGQVWGATTIDNVNIICDTLSTAAYGGTIANVVQGELTVKDTNIVIKATSGSNANSGFIAGGEANTKNVILSNVNCYNPTANATTPYNPKNAGGLTLGTDEQEAVDGEDYNLYTLNKMGSAYIREQLSQEFEQMLIEAGIISDTYFHALDNDNFADLATATSGYYYLTEDIDLSGKSWSPSGTFSGVIDGNGWMIKNFTAGENHSGIIQYSGNGATIKDLDIHMLTNTSRGGLIGQVKGATLVENVNVICDLLSTGSSDYPSGPIANVMQGELTVKDTNIIIKATSGTNALCGFVTGGEANTHNLILSNVVCYNPGSIATTPYNPANQSNATYPVLGTFGTDGEIAVAGEDYTAYLSFNALLEANYAGQLSEEFVSLLSSANISLEKIYINQDNVTDLQSATVGYYALKENVDLSSITWTPTSTFKGIFDGQGYKISNLKDKSLFHTISNAKICNLILDNVVNPPKGILCGPDSGSGNVTTDITVENLVVRVKSASATRVALLGYQTGGIATLKNVVVEMASASGYRGFITTHAANTQILENVYCIGNGKLHATEGLNATTPTYYKADGNTTAVENEDYFVYANFASFMESDEYKTLDTGLANIVDAAYFTKVNSSNYNVLNTATSGYYVLEEDIDLKDVTWAPSETFSGSLDGNGHKISNLTGTLFKTVDGAKISNLVLDNVTSTSNGILSSSQLTKDVTLTNVIVKVTSATGARTSLFGQQTAGKATLRNVVVDMFAFTTNSDYKGFLTTDAGLVSILDGVYFIGGNGKLHSPTHNANFVTEYYKANGTTTAVEDTDYFIYANLDEFVNSNEFNKFDAKFVTMICNGLNIVEVNSENIDTLATATDGYFILTENVDLSETTWAPTSTFTGVLNGNGYKISNLTGTLFGGVNNAKICNLILDNVTVTNGEGGILSAARFTTNAEINNVIVKVKGSTVARAALLGYQTGGTVTIKNVVIDMFTNSSNIGYRGFLTTHAASSVILENAYFIGEGVAMHAPTGAHATLTPTYLKADGTTVAKENVDYFKGSKIGNFVNSTSFIGLNAKFKDMIADAFLADGDSAPDYSESTEQFTTFAYNAVCDDWYQRNGTKYYLDESLATPENLQKYKDAGFNYLFVDWVFQENSVVSGYDFNSGKLKTIMDMANDIGLKCVVFQSNIYGLSNSEETIINPEKAAIAENANKFFASQEDLNAYVAKALAGLKDHPAFDGVILIDEPSYLKFQAISEVYNAVKAAAPDANVIVNLLPFAANSDEHKLLYCGSTVYTNEQAYEMYLNEYYNKVGKDMGILMYDDYPILNGQHGTSMTGNNVLPTYLYGNQVVSDFCDAKGLERITIYQSCVYSNRANVEERDIYFQMNIGQAFGNKTFAYYTYYPILNTTSETVDESGYIVNMKGEANPKYYSIQSAFEEMQVNAKALMNFEYQGMQYQKTGTLPSADYTNGLTNDTFTLLKGYTFEVTGTTGGILLVTELRDKSDGRYGYYVVNITDPEFESEASVELDFGSFTCAQIYQGGKISNTFTDSGKVSISLGAGHGAFVMPFDC